MNFNMSCQPHLGILIVLLGCGFFLWCVVFLGRAKPPDAELRRLLLQICEEMRAQMPVLPPPTIDEYRRKFCSAPIGTWTDCIDEQIGLGFSGVSGKFSETIFTDDGKGRWRCEDEEVVFDWQPVGERTIRVRCLEHIPPLEGWTDEELEEDRQWHHVEYDFMLPQYTRQPVIYDVEPKSITDNPKFLGCFGYRFGGPHKLWSC